MRSRGNINIVAPDSALTDALSAVARASGRYTLDTQDVRVVGGSGGERDVVRWEDEICVAQQNSHDDTYEMVVSDDASPPVNPAKSPRCAAFRFTVDLDTTCSAIELRLNEDTPAGFPPADPPPITMLDLAAGRCWVALYDGDANKPTTIIRTFDSWDAKRVPYIYHSSIYLGFAPNTEEALLKANYYWIVISGGDPTDPAPAEEDQWRTEELRILKDTVAGTGHMVVDNAGKHRPEAWAGGEWTAMPNADPFFRLYRRQFVLRNVPVQPGAVMPALGERGVVEQVGGVHPSLQVTGARGGMTAAMGYAQSAGASGGGSTGTGVSSDGPLEPNGVVYATGIGLIATDVTNFEWDPVTKQLLLAGGAAALPSLARIGSVDDGVFFPAGGELAAVLGGNEVLWLSDNGRVSMGPTARSTGYHFEYQGSFDEKMTGYFYNSSANAAAGCRFYLYSVNAAGEAYFIYRLVGNYWSWGYDGTSGNLIASITSDVSNAGFWRMALTRTGELQVGDGTGALPSHSFINEPALGIGRAAAGTIGFAAGGAYQWYMTASALYPVSNNAETLGIANVGVQALHLADAAHTPAAEGEVRVSTTTEAIEHRIGTLVHRNGNLIYSDGDIEESTDDGSEYVMDSCTIPAAYWAADKEFHIRAVVRIKLQPGGAARTFTLRLRLGGIAGTILAECDYAMAGSDPTRWFQADFMSDLHVEALAAAGVTIHPLSTCNLATMRNPAVDFPAMTGYTAEVMFRGEDAVSGETRGIVIDTTAAQDIVVTQEVTGACTFYKCVLEFLKVYAN